jgi:hypothetical protein
VEIKTDPIFEVSTAVRVAEVSGASQWDATADGQRLLKTASSVTASGAPASSAGTFPITVILNWPSLMGN